MANRVLLGNRATGGQGLYVSRSGEDVLTTTNPLAFDSRSACTLTVHSFGQGTSQPNGFATVQLTHNLGYKPAYAVRWGTQNEVAGSGPTATKSFTPMYWDSWDTEDYNCENEGEEDEECEEASEGYYCGMECAHTDVNRIGLDIAYGGEYDLESGQGTYNGGTIYYSYVIFSEPDFTDGASL